VKREWLRVKVYYDGISRGVGVRFELFCFLGVVDHPGFERKLEMIGMKLMSWRK
jgi:uncharacterized membrane protein